MERKIRLIASARALAPLALSVLLTLASSAQGGITFYRGGKTIGYAQTSDSQPTTPSVFYGGFDLFADNPLDLTSARVFSTSPTNPSPASPFVLTQYAPGGWISQQAYSSLAEMDAFLPNANIYGVLIEGGLSGTRLALLPAPATNLFSPEVPYFTASAFTSLNGMNPAAPFPLSWNGYTPLPGINNSPIFMSISRVSDGQSMIGTTVDNTTTSFLIPANTLAPNTQYTASLGYSSRIVGIDAGFIDADSTYNFDRSTNLLFTTGAGGEASGSTIPEPRGMQLPLVGLLMLLAALRLRPRLAARLCTLFVLATLASSAQADVDFYRVGKTIVYSQTSNSPPTNVISVYGGVDMATPAPLDFTAARVFSTKTMPPSPVPEFVLTQFSPGYWGSSQLYPSLDEMNANLPPGDTFGYLIEGGTLGSQLALLPLPATNLFSPDVPYFAGSTYSQLNGLDTTTPYTIHWNGYTPVAAVTDSPIFLAIYRVSDGQNVTGTVASNTTTAFQIPANTLRAQHALQGVARLQQPPERGRRRLLYR